MPQHPFALLLLRPYHVDTAQYGNARQFIEGASIIEGGPQLGQQKRERDAAEDTRWQHSLRGRVIDAVVNVASHVGRTQMTLKDVAELAPGDVIMITNPQRGTVHAQRVPVLEGRFGVHDGRYAVETRRWLEREPDGGADRTA